MENLIAEAKEFAISKIIRYPDRNVYHNMKFAQRLTDYMSVIGARAKINQEDINLATAAAWLVASSYGNIITSFDNEGSIVTNIESKMVANANEFFKKLLKLLISV